MSVLSSWLIARAGALSRQSILTDPRLLKKRRSDATSGEQST